MSSIALDVDRMHDLDAERAINLDERKRLKPIILHPNLSYRYPKPIVQSPWPDNARIERLLSTYGVPDFISLEKKIEKDNLYGWKYTLLIKYSKNQSKPDWYKLLRALASFLILPSEKRVLEAMNEQI